jgi:glycosyltransferase involved in cell wall biosynthesis
VVHDFSGHPFQAELARSLAGRGHQVLHVQCASYTSGKGSFDPDPTANPQYASITVGPVFARYALPRRILQELMYARRFTKLVRSFEPDLVISCNDPLIAKAGWGLWAALHRIPWIFWLQDLYSIAMTRHAAKRGRVGRRIGLFLQSIERRLLQASNAVVSITEDFGPTLDAWGIDPDKRTVIENWAPLDEVPQRPRMNPWRDEVGLGDRFVYLYAGTLGLKHNPDLLHALAEAEPEAEVVVISEGLGAERLARLQGVRPVDNLRVLPFQRWESLPDVLGAADVLVVLLEAEAGVFSVPSKVLTSLCAGRPLLASMPAANLGARTITGAGAGVVVPPGDRDAFVKAGRQLKHDDQLRENMGAFARSYAEVAFDIEDVTDRYTRVLEQALGVTKGALV